MRDRFFSRNYVFSKGFGIFSAAALLCGGLVIEEIQRLNKRLKTLPDEIEIEKAPSFSTAEVIDIERAESELRCAVKLARSRTPQLPELLPLQSPSLVSAEDELKKLITYFPDKGTSKCTKYFMDVALKRGIKAMSVYEKEAVWTFEGNYLLFSEVNREPVDKKNLVYLLQAVLGHCEINSNCTELVHRKGLQVLRFIYEKHGHDKAVVYTIGRILSIVTLYRWLHQDVLKSGWVAIFAQWLRSSDIVLSLLATKALANLDACASGNCFYGDGVYLYHPQFTDSEPIEADVVFIHGLLGGPFKTWRQQDQPKHNLNDNQHKNSSQGGNNGSNTHPQSSMTNESLEINDGSYTFCWPKDWLAVDRPNLRLLTVEYETRLSNWSVGCPYDTDRKTIDVLSKELLMKLEQSGIGKRPIIWVGHSMGGLLIKEMLRIANDMDLLRPLVKQTKGIVFYSVPHKGASLAAFGRPISYLVYPTIEVRQLTPGSQKLKALHSSFKDLMFKEGIPLLSFAEGQTTRLPFSFQAKIVPEESSDPGFGEFRVMPQLNHLNICKPNGRDAELYQLTLAFVRDCLAHTAAAQHRSS